MSLMTNILKETNSSGLGGGSQKKRVVMTGGQTPKHHPLDNYEMNETAFVENIMAKSKTPLQGLKY